MNTKLFTVVRSKETQQLYFAYRYPLDSAKFTIYDINNKTCMNQNMYRDELDILFTSAIWLRHKGGKNARKRQYLGEIQYFMTIKDHVYIKDHYIDKLIYDRSMIDDRQIYIVKSIEDWNKLDKKYPLKFTNEMRKIPNDVLNDLNELTNKVSNIINPFSMFRK